MNIQAASEHRARVEEFQREHRAGLVTLVFTDIVGSTALKQALGDREALARIQQHHGGGAPGAWPSSRAVVAPK